MCGDASNAPTAPPSASARRPRTSGPNGATDWSADEYGPESGYYVDPVVAGDSVLVGGKQVDRRAGFCQSFTLDGDERWTVEFETAVRSTAPVDDRVYAATDGRLAILS